MGKHAIDSGAEMYSEDLYKDIFSSGDQVIPVGHYKLFPHTNQHI